jgi:hypothetical protein
LGASEGRFPAILGVEAEGVVQLLILIVGTALLVVGLLFAVVGVGREPGSGGYREVGFKGPAWLMLVVLGLAALVFAAVWHWDETAADGVFGITTTTGATTLTGETATRCETALSESADEIRVRFDPGTDSARVAGRLEADETQAYVLEVATGQRLNLRVQSGAEPLLCVLDRRSGDVVSAERSFSVSTAPLPATTDYIVVIGTPAASDFELEIQIPAL